jgi:ABC-2 type transport system permease protein
MQLLYLLPVGYMLWRNFYSADGTAGFLVPILIVTAGQLGGGLAWLAVSAEDAPELIATAPVAGHVVLRAKTTAVLGAIGAIFAPFLVGLVWLAPWDGMVALAGVAAAGASATAIQYWFRAQVKRSLFRRRQTSSRIATVAEALASAGWAATGALVAAGSGLAAIPGGLVLAMLWAVWAMSPARSGSAGVG